jgi:peptidoglycan lytic transglycosylase
MPIAKWCAALPLLMLGSASANAESGLASFYPGVGKKSEMTCAHRSHPFGKKLRVSHGKISIECRVNDRGPFIRGRIIDVSTSAARALGMIDAGIVQVVVEAVDEEKAVVKDAKAAVKDAMAGQEIPVAENSL